MENKLPLTRCVSIVESSLPCRGVVAGGSGCKSSSGLGFRRPQNGRKADSCVGTVTPIPELLASELTIVCQSKLLGLVSNPCECTCGGGEAQGADGKHGDMVDFLLCDSGFAGTADSGVGGTF
jgi:hypothetical protein